METPAEISPLSYLSQMPDFDGANYCNVSRSIAKDVTHHY